MKYYAIYKNTTAELMNIRISAYTLIIFAHLGFCCQYLKNLFVQKKFNCLHQKLRPGYYEKKDLTYEILDS